MKQLVASVLLLIILQTGLIITGFSMSFAAEPAFGLQSAEVIRYLREARSNRDCYNYLKAAEKYQQALLLDVENEQIKIELDECQILYYNSISAYYKGMKALKKKNFLKAFFFFRDSLNLDPTYLRAWNGFAQTSKILKIRIRIFNDLSMSGSEISNLVLTREQSAVLNAVAFSSNGGFLSLAPSIWTCNNPAIGTVLDSSQFTGLDPAYPHIIHSSCRIYSPSIKVFITNMPIQGTIKIVGFSNQSPSCRVSSSQL